MLLTAVLVTLAVLGIAYRVYFMRIQEDVLHGPHLHARVDALFEAYAGRTLTDDGLRALEVQANGMFRDIITGVGLVPDGWRVRVQNDDVLGPVPKLEGPDGQLLHVADFEQRLRDGRIQLSAG